MELVEEIRALSRDHLLAESPIGQLVSGVADALDRLDARVRTLEDDARERHPGGLFERTEAPA